MAKRKLNWKQLDLFADLDVEPVLAVKNEPMKGIDDGESLPRNSGELSQGQSELVQGFDSDGESGTGPELGEGNSLASGLVDAEDSGDGDRETRRRDLRGDAPGDNEHGETHGRGSGAEQRVVRASQLDPDRADRSTPPDQSNGEVSRFTPPLDILVPQSARARAEANISAIRVLGDLTPPDGAPLFATAGQQEILARYSGWGACPEIFDENNEAFLNLRTELHELLDEQEYVAARHSTLNAHYTDPVIAEAMIAALERLGLPENAAVLEPGCGTGNFIGRRDRYNFVGVELDPTSAKIAQLLYPDAKIMNVDFAAKKGGGFDAAVGNVPFGDYTVADPVFNRAGHSIHNYFIIKSLRLTKPGGLAAFITSSYTLNSQNPAARVEMARYGEFLGAVRLPNSAHARCAGTTVLTDMIFFRRNDYVLAPEEAANQTWTKTEQVGLAEDGVRTNSYFVENPDMVVGTPKVTLGRFGPTLEVSLETGQDLAGLLETSLGGLAEKARAAGRGYSAAADDDALAGLEDAVGGPRLRTGSIYITQEGKFFLMGSTGPSPLPVSGTAASELHQLIKIRTAFDRLLEEEANPFGDPEPFRAVLNEVYDAYLAKYGPINRFTLSQRRQLDDDGRERVVKVYPKLGGFRKDKMFRAVAALENFDEETQIASKAAVFRQAVLGEDSQILGTEDPSEAVAVSLSQKGSVDIDSVARLLGVSPVEAREKIADLVYTDPITGSLVDAASYLSGNVRKKLAMAEIAAVENPALAKNVEALREVVPKDLDIIEIRLRLGASWIQPEVVETAFNSLCSKDQWDKTKVSYTEALGLWTVTGPRRGSKSVAITNEYGVPDHMDAIKILDNLLNNREIQVRVRNC